MWQSLVTIGQAFAQNERRKKCTKEASDVKKQWPNRVWLAMKSGSKRNTFTFRFAL